jgi:CTP:molybdopterin cytidylyltransferase MocA
MPPSVHILILAAGASSRMRGSDKLVQPIKGIPILRRVAQTAVATGMPVLVALPPGANERRAALAGLSTRVVDVPDAAQGMSRSLVRGVKALGDTARADADGLMVLPADMPGFTTEALDNLISQFQAQPDRICRGGIADGTPGHPIIFPSDLWPELAQVTGDEGGRAVLRAHPDRVTVLALPGQMAVLDLDTPEDWAAFLGHPL